MKDQTNPLPASANDGSIQGAVDALQNIDLDSLISFEEAANRNEGLPPPEKIAALNDEAEAKRNTPRDAQGKWTKAEEQPAAKDAANQQAEESTEEIDYLEIAGEEGEEPKRVPLTEVVEWQAQLEQTRKDLDEARRTALAPAEFDRQISETIKNRTEAIRVLDFLVSAMRPPEPNEDLINPNSPLYDPSAYHLQRNAYNQQQGRIQQALSERRRHEEALAEEQRAVSEAHRQREQQRLYQFWPEIKDAATQRRVVDDAKKHYGITENDFATINDSRLYALLKDALAFRQQQATRQQTAKVVKAAPKLVKAPAKSTQSKGQQTFSSAMQRLQRSGSMEDGAEAIGGLLS